MHNIAYILFMENRFKVINFDNLEHNLNYFRSILPSNTKICAVVKNNAYGHNSLKICKFLYKKVDFFAFSNNFEAITVLKAIPNLPTLIIGTFSLDCLKKALLHKVIVSVENLNQLKILNNYAISLNQKVKYQLKIDTGMNRLGIKNKKEVLDFLIKYKKYKNCILCGIFSHIGSGENQACRRTKKQLKTFNNITKLFPQNVDFHIQNTINAVKRNKLNYNIVRVGIGLYGYGSKSLLPIMSVYAKIVAIKLVKKGEYIGYGNEHKATKNIKIAIVNIGYGQGLPRLWANGGFVLINNKKAKIVANICMDMTIVDVSNCKKIKINDYALIMGANKQLNAEIIAKKCKTIPYEILTNFRDLPTQNYNIVTKNSN